MLHKTDCDGNTRVSDSIWGGAYVFNLDIVLLIFAAEADGVNGQAAIA
jgi:hypothetical protein